jgi:phosphatidylglycerophosphatase A
MSGKKFTLRQRLLLFLAEGFGFGRMPVAPGTFGSLPGVLLCWGGLELQAGAAVCVAIWLFLFLTGIPLCRIAAELREKHDPGSIVWDEITAFALLAAVTAHGWQWLVLGFILFRIFDIGKPWPVRRFERLPGGLGIMADDQIAGVYAATVLWIVQRLWQ